MSKDIVQLKGRKKLGGCNNSFYNGNTNAHCRANFACGALLCNVTCFASAIYAMVMRDFGPVFCISVSIAKGIMKLTVVVFLAKDNEICENFRQ